MTYIPLPRPSYLDKFERLSLSGGSRWRDAKGNLYEYDSLHSEVEVYNKRGRHLGVMDVITGVMIKEAVKGRSINV